MPEPSKTRETGRERGIPSLDGLRALSIAIVIFSHAEGTRGFPGWIPAFNTEHGVLGVQIFFVISGFLITTLLLDERARTGDVSLRLFYARRTLRIFPPFYLFLGVIAIGALFGMFKVPLSNMIFAATYTMNYVSNGVWITGHVWSLSVEEQFYLVWPLTMKLAGIRRSFWIAGVVALTAPAFCFFVYLYNPEWGSTITRCFPLVADSIAAGCVLAGILPWLRRQINYSKWFGSPWGDVVIPCILLLELGRGHPRLHLAFTETALNLGICYAIVRYTQFPDGRVARILNLPAIAFVGRISYSLYLWQQLFMDQWGTAILQRFPLNVAAAFGCALLSYYTVELPMAGMRRRLRAKPAPVEPVSIGRPVL